MNHVEGTFRGVRNADLYYQAWLPQDEVKSVLLIVHGLGEHCGRYMNVINHFVPLGHAVYGFDHIGHGKSEGLREVVERFTDYTDSLSVFSKTVKGWQPGKPIILLGHSMGGLIAAYYLLEHQTDFKGAVISAPVIKVSGGASPVIVILSRVLSILAPGMGFMKLDANRLSRDSEVVEAYVNDPLVFHSKTPVRLLAEMLKAMQYVKAEAQRINLPMIIIAGGEDKIVDPGGAQMLYDRVSSKDKAIKIYSGFYHEVFNEPERINVLKDVETWLAAYV